jgi:hypothetical protein
MNEGLFGFPKAISQTGGTFGWPLGRTQSIQKSAYPYSAAITTGGANAKGAWSTFTSGTEFTCDGFYIYLTTTGFANRQFLIDIAIGGVGNEIIVVNNLQLSMGAGGTGDKIYVPLSLPGGSRIAVRAQSSTATSPLDLSITIVSSPTLSSMKFFKTVTYGANTSTSGGTQVDPGGVASTFGLWSIITNATEIPIHNIIISIGNRNNSAMANGGISAQIGLTEWPTDNIIVHEINSQCSTVTDVWCPFWHSFPVYIPSGSIISARGKSNITDATDRLFDVTIIGFK